VQRQHERYSRFVRGHAVSQRTSSSAPDYAKRLDCGASPPLLYSHRRGSRLRTDNQCMHSRMGDT
jgi:hypothetical protein